VYQRASSARLGWGRRLLVPGLIATLLAGTVLVRPTQVFAEPAPASPTTLAASEPRVALADSSSAASIIGVVTSSDAPLIDGGDGRIFFPGDRRGQVRLGVVAPAGLRPTFEASPVDGWQVHQPSAGSDDRVLYLSFVPGAGALSVGVEFRDDADFLIATIERTLTAGPPDEDGTDALAGAGEPAVAVPADEPDAQPIPLGSLPRDPEYLAGLYPPATETVDGAPATSSVVALAWVEHRFATPIADRRLRIESASVDPSAGCGAWKTIDEREIELADARPDTPTSDSPISDSPAGALTSSVAAAAILGGTTNLTEAAVKPATWSATLVAPDESTAPRSMFARFPWEFELQRPVWRVGQLAVPLAGDGCLRFSLVVGDSLGGTALLAWPVVAPDRLVLSGRVLPEYDGSLDLYRRAAFASQQHYTWCIGSTGQMMVSLITGERSDPRSQPYFMAWAATHDWVDHTRWGGSDDEGLRSLLQRFSGVRYEKVWVPDTASALRLAALRMRLTGSPAEITVMDGKHAWVLHGFDSTSDPLLDSHAYIRAVYVSGPLAPRAPQPGGFDPPADSRIGPAALRHYLSPAGSYGPWKVVVPVPGPRGWAAPQPLSLAAVGLRWWPLNIFSEFRALPDLRTADVSPIAPPSQSVVPTASPTVDPLATPTVDPLATPTLDPGATPTVDPGATPTPDPTIAPTPDPTLDPTPDPTAEPPPPPTPDPTAEPPPDPTPSP
jgi:hypothetical protein